MATPAAPDGQEWARQVRPCGDGEPADFAAVDIGSLLRESGCDRISILKVDVEGAERVIFAEHFEDWIGLCDNIVIELHGPNCERVFADAIAGQPFRVSRCGELTVCSR
jgi:FkbM family methyltransferase